MKRKGLFAARGLLALAVVCCADVVFGQSRLDGCFQIGGSMTISNPGSYVVTRDIVLFAGTVMLVQADDVTIDLNGHTIVGGFNFFEHAGAIFAGADVKNLVVRNGTVIGGWGPGIQATGSYNRVEDVCIRESSRGAVLLGDDARLLRCIVTTNQASAGGDLVRIGSRSQMADCTVSLNHGGYFYAVHAGDHCAIQRCAVSGNRSPGYIRAIQAGRGSVIRACSVTDNDSGSSFGGIQVAEDSSVETCAVADNHAWTDFIFGLAASEGSVVSRCAVYRCRAESGAGFAMGFRHSGHGVVQDCATGSNRVETITGSGFILGTNVTAMNCASWGNAGIGFAADDGCTLRYCVSKFNGYLGFSIYRWNTVERCLADNNPYASPSATDFNIELIGDYNRVENCHVMDSGVGIEVSGARNFVSGNSGWNYTTNFSYSGGNSYGRLWNLPGTNFQSSVPWQNFGL